MRDIVYFFVLSLSYSISFHLVLIEQCNLRSPVTNIHLLYLNVFRYIRRNQLDAGFLLFETESLKWLGFVEFDDVNGKVITYSAQYGYVLNVHCTKWHFQKKNIHLTIILLSAVSISFLT
jgi:hypothetical protein